MQNREANLAIGLSKLTDKHFVDLAFERRGVINHMNAFLWRTRLSYIPLAGASP